MFGDNLKKLRISFNKTQSEMGDFLNISTVAYGDYERNKSQPDLISLIKLSNYFGVSIDYLLDNLNVDYIIKDIKAKLSMMNKEELITLYMNGIENLLKSNKKI